MKKVLIDFIKYLEVLLNNIDKQNKDSFLKNTWNYLLTTTIEEIKELKNFVNYIPSEPLNNDYIKIYNEIQNNIKNIKKMKLNLNLLETINTLNYQFYFFKKITLNSKSYLDLDKKNSFENESIKIVNLPNKKNEERLLKNFYYPYHINNNFDGLVNIHSFMLFISKFDDIKEKIIVDCNKITDTYIRFKNMRLIDEKNINPLFYAFMLQNDDNIKDGTFIVTNIFIQFLTSFENCIIYKNNGFAKIAFYKLQRSSENLILNLYIDKYKNNNIYNTINLLRMSNNNKNEHGPFSIFTSCGYKIDDNDFFTLFSKMIENNKIFTYQLFDNNNITNAYTYMINKTDHNDSKTNKLPHDLPQLSNNNNNNNNILVFDTQYMQDYYCVGNKIDNYKPFTIPVTTTFNKINNNINNMKIKKRFIKDPLANKNYKLNFITTFNSDGSDLQTGKSSKKIKTNKNINSHDGDIKKNPKEEKNNVTDNNLINIPHNIDTDVDIDNDTINTNIYLLSPKQEYMRKFDFDKHNKTSLIPLTQESVNNIELTKLGDNKNDSIEIIIDGLMNLLQDKLKLLLIKKFDDDDYYRNIYTLLLKFITNRAKTEVEVKLIKLIIKKLDPILVGLKKKKLNEVSILINDCLTQVFYYHCSKKNEKETPYIKNFTIYIEKIDIRHIDFPAIIDKNEKLNKLNTLRLLSSFGYIDWSTKIFDTFLQNYHYLLLIGALCKNIILHPLLVYNILVGSPNGTFIITKIFKTNIKSPTFILYVKNGVILVSQYLFTSDHKVQSIDYHYIGKNEFDQKKYLFSILQDEILNPNMTGYKSNNIKEEENTHNSLFMMLYKHQNFITGYYNLEQNIYINKQNL